MAQPTAETHRVISHSTGMRAAVWEEPYRVFFLTGAVYAAAFLGFWGAHLLSIDGVLRPLAPTFTVAQHAHLMIWGVWGAYVFGFSLTAYPKQNNGAPLPLQSLKGLFALFLLSQLLLVVGWMNNRAALALGGKLCEVGAYLWLLSYLTPIGVRELRRAFWWQPLAVLIALWSGLIALVLFNFGPATAAWPSLHSALWGYFVFLITAFSYRLIPFFTSRVAEDYILSRGKYFLPVLMAILWLVPALRRPATMWAFYGLNALALAWCVREWLRWGPASGVRIPLIAVLHLGWMWLFLALLVASLGWIEPWFPINGFNHTHILTVGFFATFIVSISTRVTLGHGGRPLQLGSVGAAVVLLVQVAAVLRVFGAQLFPDTSPLRVNAAGAFVLAGAFALWLTRFGACLVLPKIPPEKICPK